MQAAPAPAPAPPPVAAAAPAAPPAAPAPAPAPAPQTARPAPQTFAAAKEVPDIYFDFDKATIRPDAAQTLQASADWLKSNNKSAVLVEGHCDERGTNEYNIVLGDRRAKATRDFLVSQGVAASRITTISYGEERPTCSEHSEQCWSKNRRAHLVMKPE
jgi:peptidoglycan-associated lipoprotein